MRFCLKTTCFLVCSFLLISCHFNKLPSESSVNKLRLPDTLITYSLNKDSLLLDSSQLANYSFLKIYAFIDVSCPSCLADIDQWRDAVPKFMKYKVPVILICSTKDNFEYLQYLFENGQVKNFPFPLYFDITNQLYNLNTYLDENMAHKVVLTDQYNTVLAMGSPILSQKIKEDYLKIILENAISH